MLRSLVLGAVGAAIVGEANAARSTPVAGAEEGSEFWAGCPFASNLVGIEVYSRDDIDAVRPICASAFGPKEIGEPTPAGEPQGGRAQGARVTTLRCPPEAPIVVGASMSWETVQTTGLNSIRLECGVAGENPLDALKVGGEFTAPTFKGSGVLGTAYGAGLGVGAQGCPHSNFSTYVAVGLHGWSAGDWIHGLGFSCDNPGFAVKRVGRIKPKPPVGLTTGAVAGPSFGAAKFCESYAVDAVAAAAENLKKQCGYEGGRWAIEAERHRAWCEGLNGDQAVPNAEAAARAEALASCASSEPRPDTESEAPPDAE